MGNCSFCGKTEHQGVRLVRGPDVAICEECVALAVDSLEGMPEPDRSAGSEGVHLRLFTTSEARGVRPSDDAP
jgi:ATP-dependent protease Clp ATPase subunit